MSKYQDDILYQVADSREVKSGLPEASEGNEGDERWVQVDGKGLYHCKKYGGQWNSKIFSEEVIEEGASVSTGVSTAGGSTTTGDGDFDTIIVQDESTLQTQTTISGTLDVSGNLGSFPTSSNLKVESNSIDTVQDIQTGSSPTFSNLTLTTNLDTTSIKSFNATTLINNHSELYTGGTYSIAGGGTASGGIGLSDLTEAEVDQLEAIGSTTISAGQWGYVGGMDQPVATTNDVVFAKTTLTDSGKSWSFDPIGDAGDNANLTTGGLQITTSNTADSPIIIGGNSYDDHTVRNYAYTSGLFTGDGWSIYEDNNLHNMEIDNLQVRGTLSVYELLIQQIRATNGSVFITSAAKLTTDGNSVKLGNASIWTLTFETDEDDSKPHPFADHDLILARRCDISGDTTNIVSEVRFTVNNASGGNASQLYANLEYSSITLPTTAQEETAVLNGFDFVRIGNTQDANRQGGIYLTSDDTLAPFIDIFDEVSSWQEWDGITNIFGIGDGSFDLATTGTHTGDNVVIPGSSWKSYSPASGGDSGNVQIIATGGISNQKYCKIDTLDNNTSYIYQTITFPYIASGSYKVIIEWYGKQDPVTSNEPRIMVRDAFPGSHSASFTTAGIFDTGQPPSFIDWEDITAPEAQRTATTVWHKYEWELTVPSTMFSGTADKVMYLIFSTAPTTAAANTWVDDVKISMQGKVKTRIGRLEGVGKTGYGLWGENVYLKGRIEASEGYIGNEFSGWRIDSLGITNEGATSYISAGQTTVGLDGGGSYLDGAGDLSLGNSASAGLKWDQSESLLTVRGVIHMAAGSTTGIDTPKTFKIVSIGKGGTASNVGFFETASDGTITNQLTNSAGSPGGKQWALMQFSAEDNAIKTSFGGGDGIVWYDLSGASDALAFGTAINAMTTGDIAMICTWNNPNQSYHNNGDLVAALGKIGATTEALDQMAENGSYILIGEKRAAAHTQGTELVGQSGIIGDPYEISMTVQLLNSSITILSHEGELNDFDASTTNTFKYERSDGFKGKAYDNSDPYYRTLLSFPMPYVKTSDEANVNLVLLTKNMGDYNDVAEGNLHNSRLYLNGTSLGSINDVDNNNTHSHVFDSITGSLWNNNPGDANVFEVRSEMDFDSNTMFVYQCILYDNLGSVYDNGALPEPSGSAADGLYLTSDSIGFYKGSQSRFVTKLDDSGGFLFSDPSTAPNFTTPSSGGAYITYRSGALEINADMIGGIIKSQNLTTSAGTQINLTDGTLTTAGTSTSTGLVIASDGSITTNGATITGGTITGQLMLANYAEGDVDFVTDFIGAATSSYHDVVVNGVNRLKCNRVCDSLELDFNMSSNINQSKILGIWMNSEEQPGSDGSPYNDALNRVASSAASTKLIANAPGFPFMTFQFFTKEGDAENKEQWKMLFALENTNYYLIFRLGARIDKVGDDGGEVVFGMHTCTETEYNSHSGSDRPDFAPWTSGGSTAYNLLYHSGGVNADEDDYSDMQIEQIDIGNFTITAISEVRHLQDGTTNIINAGVDFYLSGGGVDGVAAGTSNSNRMRIEANKEGSGSYVIDSNIYFPAGMFRVYN